MGIRGVKPSIFAIYKGDQFLCIGTRKECAEALGISRSSMESRISKSASGKISYENRLIAVKLD